MSRRTSVAALTALLAVAGVAWLSRSPAVPPARPAVGAALARAAVAVTTDDPAASDADLRPLIPILGGRRVVALGEATHGTREFFRLKDRIVRLLVRHAGFTTFALEISPEAAERMNRYVRDGSGDVDEALRRFEFWTWQTEEVRELAQWLRQWNIGVPEERRVAFVGINATGDNRDRRMAQNVMSALEAGGSQGRLIVWAHNAHVSSAPGWMGSYLRESLGSAMYVVGFEFSEGSFRSRNVWRRRIHSVPPAGDDYYAHALARLESPIAFVDFATALRQPALAEWLTAPRRSRDIAETFFVSQFAERWHSQLESWPRLYDGILFVRSTTPARGLFDR
jgi:erythromycin esterase-like protein